jgi:Ca2+-transporting ATPase
MLATIVLAGYWSALQRHGEGPQARSVAVLLLIAVQMGHAFNCRSRVHSALERPFANPFLWLAMVAVILLQLAAAGIAPLARVLQVRRPDPADWLLVALATILPIAIVEVQKLVARKSSRVSGTRTSVR